MLTDVAGVKDKDGNLISHLTVLPPALSGDGTVQGGMIPKVETGMLLVRAEAVVILDGRAPHAVLVELLQSMGLARRSQQTKLKAYGFRPALAGVFQARSVRRLMGTVSGHL